MSNVDTGEFNIWLPIMPLQKSEAVGPMDERPLRGCASAEEPDRVRETIIHKGMDFSPALQAGYINWDHQEKVLGPAALIGRPRVLEVVRAEDHPVVAKSGAVGPALYIEGYLWPASYGHHGADEAWALAQASADSGLPLGWSIQGGAVARQGMRITKSVIKHVALTYHAIHHRTFAELCKSFGDGDGNAMTTASAQPLRLEHLDGRLTSVLWGDGACGHFRKSGEFIHGVRGAMEHLVKCRDASPREAMQFVEAIRKSGMVAA